VRIVSILLIFFIGCTSTKELTRSGNFYGNVNFGVEDLELSSSTPWFSDDTIFEIDSTDYVMDQGNQLLTDVLYGYASQLQGIEKTSSEEADLLFVIKKIEVERGLFTFNFPNPGPLYRMKMLVEIRNSAGGKEIVKLKTLVNMSIVNFSHLSFKWLSLDEMKNPEYQLATFEAGLRKMYQDLYFNYFDISLRL